MISCTTASYAFLATASTPCICLAPLSPYLPDPSERVCIIQRETPTHPRWRDCRANICTSTCWFLSVQKKRPNSVGLASPCAQTNVRCMCLSRAWRAAGWIWIPCLVAGNAFHFTCMAPSARVCFFQCDSASHFPDQLLHCSSTHQSDRFGQLKQATIHLMFLSHHIPAVVPPYVRHPSTYFLAAPSFQIPWVFVFLFFFNLFLTVDTVRGVRTPYNCLCAGNGSFCVSPFTADTVSTRT